MNEVTNSDVLKKPSALSSRYTPVLLAVLVLLGLYLTGLHSYLLFHSIVEVFTIIVSCSIFIIAWDSRRFLDNHYLLFIGISSLFISGLDLVHLLGYKGIGILPEYGSTLSTQLWIAARYVQSVSFLAAPLFISRKFKLNLVFLTYSLVVFLLLASILYWRNFPVTFIDGTGVTAFKTASEYIISAIFLGSVGLLIKKRREFDRGVVAILCLSVILNIAAELVFSSYTDLFGLSNITGHFLRLSAYYLIYKAIVETGLTRPYDLLFWNLKQSEEGLKRYASRLEEMVKERTATLLDTNANLLKEVTERRQAEETLRTSEEELRLIFESAAEAIVVGDLKGVILRANSTAAKIGGYDSPVELVGKTIFDFIVVREHQEVRAKIQTTVELGMIGSMAFTLVRKDGAEFPIEASAGSLKDASGNPRGLVILLRDITERRKAEEDLRRSEKKYSTIVEQGNDGIVIVRDGLVVFSNTKMAQMTGFSPVEIIGKPFLDFVAPDNRILLADHYEKRIRGEAVPDRYEAKLLHKNGETIVIEFSISVIEHEGKPSSLVIARDVTERTKLLEQIMAQDRLASIGQLVAGVSHEIKNPLTSVIGFSELLLANSACKDFAADLKIINDESKRIVEIVNNLLIFAKKQPEGKAEIQINEQIERVIALRAHDHKANNIQVISKLAPDLPPIMANGSQMLQVFFNIVVNAEQAMLEVHKKGTLTIKTALAGNMVRASFADDGPGISPENVKKLFIPFFTTKGLGKGTGLGLSICHGIVAEHGGKIYAESEPGKGATFVVELPFSRVTE